jgi:DNA-binding beta-propeller fold protein YncE
VRNEKSLRVAVQVLSALAVCGLIAAGARAAGTGQQPLRLVRTLSLPGAIHGHFDHLVVDTTGRRLFVTPEDYHKVLVLDLSTGKVTHEITGIEKPHAILYRPEINRIFVTDGTDGSVKVFDAKTYQPVGRIPLLKDADSIGYDPATKYLYVDNGGGDVGQKYSMLSVVDTSSNRKIADIRIEGDTIEAMALEANRPRLYVNNREKNEVAVVDRSTQKVMSTWPIKLGKVNVTMALDEAHHRLFVGCRSGQLVVMDTSSGKELQVLSIVKGVDDMVYDEASHRLYAAGDGAASIYEEIDADHYHLLGDVPTGPVGKTARLVPSMGRYFVAVPQHGTVDASILEFELDHKNTAADVPPPPPLYEVDAPAAERLVVATLSAHSCLIKLGLHGVAPGHQQSVILANGNTSKIGKATTAEDFANIKDGKTWCRKDVPGEFYDLKMPMFDASGRGIGMLVMEIPLAAAKSPEEAVQMAEGIRKEMSAKIPDMNSLFRS